METEAVLEILTNRRDIYAAKEVQANGMDLKPNYDRWDLFKHTREALDIVIDEVRVKAGLPPLSEE